MNEATKAATTLVNRIDGLPVNEAARSAARNEFDRAERAAEWTVLVMDRLDFLIEGMRRTPGMRQRRAG